MNEDRGKRRFTGSCRRVRRACSVMRRIYRRAQLRKPLVFGSLRKCGVLMLSNLHRKERYALRLDLVPLAGQRGVFGLRSATRCDWKTSIPVTGYGSDCVGYDRSKAADVTEGVLDRYLYFNYLTGYGSVKRNGPKTSHIHPALDISLSIRALIVAYRNTFRLLTMSRVLRT